MSECPRVKRAEAGSLECIASNALIAGATGFVGGRLAESLAGSGARVRCLVRDRSRATRLESLGLEIREGDVTDAASLEGVGEGLDVAYFLVHSMGGGEGYAERERLGARNFARMASREGVERVVYLGGLGDETRVRAPAQPQRDCAGAAAAGPPLTYFRAAMVVGAGSESYRTLRYLVGRLPVMIAPAWLKTQTRSRSGSRRWSSTCAARPRCRSRRGERCRSAGPTCSATRRCSTGWRS